MTAGRGPGRPVTFDDVARSAYLAALAAGGSQAQAAATAGVTARTVQLAARADAGFADRQRMARAAGRAMRHAMRLATDGIPHGEYRYNHHECRCDVCRKAASEARAGRRPAPPAVPMRTRPPTSRQTAPQPIALKEAS